MMLITWESLQNLTNIVNAVVISIDCQCVSASLFHGFYPLLTENRGGNPPMIQSFDGITSRQIILGGNVAKMLLNYYKNASTVCSSWDIIFSLHKSEISEELLSAFQTTMPEWYFDLCSTALPLPIEGAEIYMKWCEACKRDKSASNSINIY